MKKILIIEDDQVVGNAFYNHLMAEGFHVKSATDGESGLKIMLEFKPDLLLLDLILPRKSGLEVLQQVRSDASLFRTPVVVFTNAYQSNMVQEAWKVGATKCLSKSSFTPRELLEIVHLTLREDAEDPSHFAPFSQPPEPNAAPALAPPAAPAPSEPAASNDSGADTDFVFQAGLRKNYFESRPATLAAMRAALQSLIKAGSESNQLQEIQALYRRVHALAGTAGLAGMVQVAHLASAIEALLKEIQDKPANLNPSTLRTIAAGVDTLARLFETVTEPDSLNLYDVKILVVDDEEISRRAISYALEKAGLQSTNVDSGEAAYKLLVDQPFDLVFLDVDMPGMSGFELCAKLRGMPAHKKTPVVFVTALSDFDHRTSSTMAGGNDFIGKPFLFIELTVKGLIHLLRGKLLSGK